MSVTLVGAGPGDPGLITVRGLERLRACDAVVYDRLVAPELVDEAPADALRICRDGLDQEAVDRLLVVLGRELDVVRLKGGDPFVFGRGGEEALALAEADVPFEVVPGVSALAAVPAAAGIPVTHRGLSDRVTIATAHAADGSEPDYAQLAATGGTLVLFMGLGRLSALADGLDRRRPAGEHPGGRRLPRHAARPDDGERVTRGDRRAVGRIARAGARGRRRRRRSRRPSLADARRARRLSRGLTVKPPL